MRQTVWTNRKLLFLRQTRLASHQPRLASSLRCCLASQTTPSHSFDVRRSYVRATTTVTRDTTTLSTTHYTLSNSVMEQRVLEKHNDGYDVDEHTENVSYTNKLELNRESFESLLKRRFFIAPAFSIYGGTFFYFFVVLNF